MFWRNGVPRRPDSRMPDAGPVDCRQSAAVRRRDPVPARRGHERPEGESRRQPGESRSAWSTSQPGSAGSALSRSSAASQLQFNEELLFANHAGFTRGCWSRAFVWRVCIWRRLALWTARISCEPKFQMSRGALGRSAATVRGGGAAARFTRWSRETRPDCTLILVWHARRAQDAQEGR